MKWYRHALGSSNNSSMIERGLPEVVELGLDKGFGRLPEIPGPWPRPGEKRRKKSKRERLLRGREPASQQANLPTDAVGNAPEGTGRMGLS